MSDDEVLRKGFADVDEAIGKLAQQVEGRLTALEAKLDGVAAERFAAALPPASVLERLSAALNRSDDARARELVAGVSRLRQQVEQLERRLLEGR